MASETSAQDHAVRHQVVVPDKVPSGEYPVRNWPLISTQWHDLTDI